MAFFPAQSQGDIIEDLFTPNSLPGAVSQNTCLYNNKIVIAYITVYVTIPATTWTNIGTMLKPPKGVYVYSSVMSTGNGAHIGESRVDPTTGAVSVYLRESVTNATLQMSFCYHTQ